MKLNEETLGFWEKLIKMKNRYGYWQLIKIVVFVGCTIAFLFSAKNIGENFTLDRQKAVLNQAITEVDKNKAIIHGQQMDMRETIKPLISNLLKSTLVNMNADRAFVIELHNGSNNTAGLPFIHCTMTYEEDARNIEPIDDDYQNLTLSRFNFPEYLHDHDLFIGDLAEFEKIDPKAAMRIKNNNVTYIVLTTIRSDRQEIGYFGFTYCNNKKPVEEKDIMEFVVHTVQKLSKLLDKNEI